MLNLLEFLFFIKKILTLTQEKKSFFLICVRVFLFCVREYKKNDKKTFFLQNLSYLN